MSQTGNIVVEIKIEVNDSQDRINVEKSEKNEPKGKLKRKKSVETGSGNEKKSEEKVKKVKGPYASIPDIRRQDLIRFVYEEGFTIKEAARLLQLNYSSARKIKAVYQEQGRINAKIRGGGNPRRVLTKEITQKVEKIISKNPNLSLAKLRKRLLKKKEVEVSLSSLSRCLQELMIFRQLNDQNSKQVNSDEAIDERKDYSYWFLNVLYDDPCSIVFVDESRFDLRLSQKTEKKDDEKEKMEKKTKKKIKIEQDQEEEESVPKIVGRALTLMASMTINEMEYCKTVCPSEMNSETFSNYLNELCNDLYSKGMRSMFIILNKSDNHKKEDIENIISKFGFRYQFLPRYSFMLTPLEGFFNDLKLKLRSKLEHNDDVVKGVFSEIIMKEIDETTLKQIESYFHSVDKNARNCSVGLAYSYD